MRIVDVHRTRFRPRVSHTALLHYTAPPRGSLVLLVSEFAIVIFYPSFPACHFALSPTIAESGSELFGIGLGTKQTSLSFVFTSTTPLVSLRFPFPSPVTAAMAARVFRLDELTTQIAADLLAISPRSTVSFGLTCKALQVPALMALWETQCSLDSLVKRVLPPDSLLIIKRRHSDICSHVSPPFSSSQHPGYSPTTKR